MTFAQLAFSFRGRMRRQDFWLGQILVGFTSGFLYIVTAAFREVAGALELSGAGLTFAGLVQAGIKIVMMIGIVWAALAIAVKRGHDRNRPAVWILAVYALDVAVAVLASFSAAPARWCWAAQLVVAAYVVVDLGLMDGLRDADRYGPSPKAPATRAEAPA